MHAVDPTRHRRDARGRRAARLGPKVAGLALGLAGLLVPALPAAAAPVAGAVQPGPSQVERAEPASDALAGALAPVLDAGAPGALAGVRVDGALDRAAAGVANVDTSRPAHPGDRYRIGSNTKTMTAVVVLQLVEEGRLSLDDPLVDHLPRFDLDPRMTVRHALQQTTGLPTNTGIWNDPDSVAKNRFRAFTPTELVETALANFPEPRPEPGTSWTYSNTNYVLAGLVVESVTGHSLRTELRHRVFSPLGLRHTSFPSRFDPLLSGPALHGYVPGGNGTFEDMTTYNPSWAWAAGAVISTTSDETMFMRGLFDGTLLSEKSLEVMTDVGEFGYGLALLPIAAPCLPGGVAWGHDGIVFGYTSMAAGAPDGSRQAAVAANLSADEGDRVYPALAGALTDVICATDF